MNKLGIMATLKQLQMDLWGSDIVGTSISEKDGRYTLKFVFPPNYYLAKRELLIEIKKEKVNYTLSGSVIIRHYDTSGGDIKQKVYEQAIPLDLDSDCMQIYNLVRQVYCKILACV